MSHAKDALQSHVLETPEGMRLRVLNLGAAVQSLRVPTRQGPLEVALGFARAEQYLHNPHFIGVTVGRYANRIGGAEFTLNGRRFTLQGNESRTGNCLHGGDCGFHAQLWAVSRSRDGRALVCRHGSPDGQGGFPGNLQVTVEYRLVNTALRIEYRAVCDQDTVLSLTNHTYFTLDPARACVDEHEIQVHADYYTPTDSEQIPTGEWRAVQGTDFDLRRATPLRRGDRLARFDHNFALARWARSNLRPAAELYAPATGLRMRMSTTQAGLQLYTGDKLDGEFASRQGLCLEPQAFPDAPNQPQFPSARLRAGATYRHTIVFDFMDEPPRC